MARSVAAGVCAFLPRRVSVSCVYCSVLDAVEIERCLTELNTPDLLPAEAEDARSQV